MQCIVSRGHLFNVSVHYRHRWLLFLKYVVVIQKPHNSHIYKVGDLQVAYSAWIFKVLFIVSDSWLYPKLRHNSLIYFTFHTFQFLSENLSPRKKLGS